MGETRRRIVRTDDPEYAEVPFVDCIAVYRGDEVTAHKKGGDATWRNYQQPAPKVTPSESWWAEPQSWDEFSRAAAIEVERMRHGKTQYYWQSVDRFAIWE